MKNKNLLNRLWTDSHEKQSPQRFGRYAAMLMMLLTLGVGQMWAEALHVRGYGGTWSDTDANAMTGNNSPWTFTASWTSNWEFKIFTDTKVGDGGYLATNNTLSLNTPIQITMGGNMQIPSWSSGTYTITVTKDNSNNYYMTITSGSGGGGGGGGGDTYTVAGNNTTLFDTSWDEKNTDNDMTDNGDGTYTWSMTNVTLTSGTVEFKVVKNHNWSNAWPSSNYQLSIPSNGTYDVTITFDSSTEEVSAEATPVVSNYTVTYAVGTSYTTMGSLGAYDNTSSSAVGASPATVARAHSVTFTATPNAYYEVEGWYTNAACTSGKHDAGSTTYTVASLSSDLNVYVKFKLIDYTITYKDQGNVVYSGNNSGSLIAKYNYGTGVASLVAGAKNGYTFVGWYADSGCTGSKVTSISNTASGNKTLYAKWTENMTTVTINVSPSGAGTLTLGGAFTPGNTTTAGVSTSRTVVAAANSGYTFVGWQKEGHTAGTASSTTYTLKGDGTASSTGTLTAVFSTNVSSGWYLVGDLFTASDNWRNTNYPLNASYRGISNIAYRVVNFNSTNNKYFKLYHNSRQYGQNSGNDQAVVTGTQYTFMDKDGAEKAAFKTNGQGTVWCVADYGNNKFWVQNPTLYFPVTLSNGSSGNNLSGTEGTIALTTNNYGNLATVNYAIDERINISVTANSGYWIDDISINGTSLATNVNASSWSGYTTMPSSTATLTVTYNRYYSLSYLGNGNTGGSAPTTTYHISGTNATAATNTFIKTGHNFTVWKDGSSNEYAAGDPITMTANVVLSAQWTLATYAITYNPASPTNFAYTVKPASGTYNTTVSITVTPSQDYKITSYSAYKTGASGTSVSVSHTAGTNVYTFTQPAYGVTFNVTAASYGLSASISSKSYENRTFTLSKSSTYNPEGTLNTNWFVYYTCTAKPDGASCSINQSTGVATVDKDGDYTFKVQYRTAAAGAGTLLAESSGVTGTMRTIPDRSGLTINHEKYNSTYMNGNGASETPYFVYLSNASSYGKLNLTATLPAALLTGETLYYSVEGAEIGTVTVDGTAASVTMDLPNKTVGADRTAAIKFYSKLDGQEAPSAKMASATVYYTIGANPVVTVSATYNGEEIVGEIPQNAEITVSASVTNIPGSPTFLYKKGSGEYSSTTTYTIADAGTTTMTAKTSYLGDWTGTKTITTYAANAVTYVTRKTDMYGDDASTSTTRLFKSSGEEFTAPDIEGYTFSDWSCTGADVRVSDDGKTWGTSSTNQTVYVKAPAAGSTLTAHYNEVKRIYFDNSKAKWSGDIYVYLFSGDSWYNDYNSGNDNGPGVVPRLGLLQEYGQMTQIGVSDIYYYEYTTPYANVAFSIGEQHDYGHLYDTKGVWRTDFSTCNPCYVAPENSDQTKYDHGNNKPTYYYNSGYWRRYMPAKSGYSLWFSDQEIDFLPEDPSVDGENFIITVLRGATTTYEFNIHNSCMSKSWGNTGTMTKDNCTDWTFSPTSKDVGNCHITTTANGNYVFHLSTANGQIKLSVEYPLSVGDYQIYYTDNTGKNNNYSNYIRKNTGSEAKDDIVSFYVKKESSPTYQVKRCSGFDGSGNPEWDDVGTAQSISVTKDSVYNFTFRQPSGGESIALTGTPSYYSGNYYIRTDGAPGGWANYMSNPSNTMKYTDKASALAAGYNYYFVKWIGDADGNSTTNVKFVIANDYNNSLSQEMANDAADGSLSGGQALTGKGANVRFTWNASTNGMTRSYIGGSGHDANYLVISGTNLQKSDGSAWSTSALNDKNDWIYTYELKAANEATIMIQSHYNDKYVTILPNETVLVVTDEEYYDLRIIYDYKTNEVVAAYIPNGDISSELEIDVDIMFVRKAKDNHETAAPTTMSFSGGGKITGDPKTLYGAIEFEKDYVRGEGSYAALSSRRPERSTYWISFPFDVQVKDIFGLGEYTDTWILQRYRGDLRASKGWFLDTPTFWEYIMDREYVLKAGQGYVLSLDCEAIQWPNSITTQYLYFPSKDKIKDITSVLPSADLDVPEYTCSITSPADRTIKDSHWNVIGIPGFTQAWGLAEETVTVVGGDFHYFYTWSASTNTLSSASAKKYQFEFMHSYMVQYHGKIEWSADEPELAPARRSENAKPEEVEFKLQILKGEQEADHAFITLMDKEQITTGFDMNSDLVKMENANKTNIYTIINGDIQVAANCLPMTEQTAIVPVGVKIAANGDYTFSIPEGTEGIGVTLIDTETGVHTILSALDYTINLNAGTYNERFVLEISPIKQTPTDIELLNGGNGENGVRKVMIDGILYIVRGNKIFDARGNRVK